MAEPISILVFGTTKAGKTSTCNLLTNYGDVRPVSDAAVGTTFESYSFQPVHRQGRSYVFTDTAGLNESDKGKRPSEQALIELATLIRNSEAGFNLLFHVFRGAITTTDKANYDLFVKTIAADKIPCILVVTGCEAVEPMSKWAEENAESFHNEGMIYKQIIPICARKGEGRYEIIDAPLRQESSHALFQAIDSHALTKPEPLTEPDGDITAVLKRVLRKVLIWTEQYDWVKDTVNKNLWNALEKLGYPKKKVAELAHELSSL